MIAFALLSVGAFVPMTPPTPALAPAPLFAEHKDERIGFKMQTPREWSAIPQTTDERWIVGKYLANKSDFYTEKGGWTAQHRAEMQMIAFVSEGLKERMKVDERVGRDGKRQWVIEIESPFKDYKDFLAKRYSGGGFYLSDEKETTLGDIKVTCLEHKVERMSREGPKRLITWIYHIPDVDLAVQFECLEGAFAKLNPEMQRCYKSFKTIARTEGNLAEVSTPGRALSFKDLESMAPEERKVHRGAMEREAHKKAAAATPEGWTTKTFGRFLVIHHTDDKHAKQVTDNVQAVFDWLDKTLPFVGTGEYVRAPIVRIYKNFDELRSFVKDAESSPANLEIFTYQDHGGAFGGAMKMLNRQAMRLWFYDRDSDLYFTLPPWLSVGLGELVSNLRTKNGKVEFLTNQGVREWLRDAGRKGKASAPREIMNMSSEDFGDDDGVHVLGAVALVSFMVNAEGPMAKKTKDLMSNYMRNIKTTAKGIEDEKDQAREAVKKGEEAKPDGEKPDGEEEEEAEEDDEESEEDEDARFKDRQERWKREEKRLMEEAFRLTFGAWKEEDWKAFDNAYAKFID